MGKNCGKVEECVGYLKSLETKGYSIAVCYFAETKIIYCNLLNLKIQ